MSLTIILSICITDTGGQSEELTITEDNDVFCRYGSGQPCRLEKTRRDVDDFIWEVEGFVQGWDKDYGPGGVTEPGGWMVVLEKDRRFTKYQGCSDYPPDWEEFVELVDDFLMK